MSYLSDSLQFEQDVRDFLRRHALDAASANNLRSGVGSVTVRTRTEAEELRSFLPLRPLVIVEGYGEWPKRYPSL